MQAQDSSLSGWTILLDDHAATERFARVLVDELRAGDLVTLSGGLGAGKTTLARALIRLLADDPDLEVPSPTFTLMQTYEGTAGAIVHADFYRLGGGQELVELGWDDATETAITLVEWPERADDALKAERLHIELEFAPGAGGRGRVATLTGSGAFSTRLRRLRAFRGLVDKSGWADAARAPMPSDASVIRSYERLVKPSGETASADDFATAPGRAAGAAGPALHDDRQARRDGSRVRRHGQGLAGAGPQRPANLR